MFGAERAQQGDIAEPAMPEAKAFADPDLANPQARDQQASHEVLGAARGQVSIEPQQAQDIHAHAAEALDASAHRRQPCRSGTTGGEELARQGLEADRHCRHTERGRTGMHAAQQGLMADMQAIEATDAHHAALRAQRPAIEIAEQFRHSGRL